MNPDPVIDFQAERARRRPQPEPWVNKKHIARHLGYSTRWVGMRLAEGMPSELWGGERRFQISQVEAWLREHYKDTA